MVWGGSLLSWIWNKSSEGVRIRPEKLFVRLYMRLLKVPRPVEGFNVILTAMKKNRPRITPEGKLNKTMRFKKDLPHRVKRVSPSPQNSKERPSEPLAPADELSEP